MLDGFFIRCLIIELRESLLNSRLEKIHQINDKSFVFFFYHRGKKNNLKINLDPHSFSAFITTKKESSNISSQFLSSLKKNLEGGLLNSISQYKTDRVIVFDFTVYDFIDGPIKKKLIFEAMGKHSNLLLVKNGLIVDTFKKMFFTEGRQLLPMAKFEFFPSTKKPFTNIDYSNVSIPKELVANYLGVSPFLANYLFEHKPTLLDIPINPTRSLSLNKNYCFDIFDHQDEKIYYSSLSEMLDNMPKIEMVSQSSHKTFIEKQLKKYYNKKQNLEHLMVLAKENLNNKNKGDLVYQSGLPLNQRSSSLDVNDSKIVLDPTKTLNENAQIFFKLYQKAKRTVSHLFEQNKINDNLIKLFIEFKTYLELSVNDNLADFETDLIPFGFTKARPIQKSKKKERKPNILTLIDDDIVYYIGRNSLQNAYVTHKLGKKDNYWFHVKGAPGAHLVVTATNLTEAVLRKSAMLAAHFSSLKHSSSIPVDYTRIKFVRKISGLPGFQVNYKNQKTIFIDIDQAKITSYLK